MMRRAENAFNNLLRFVLLTVVGTLVALTLMILGSIAVNQVLPFSSWVELNNLQVTGGRLPRVNFDRVVSRTVDANLRVVLRNENTDENICSASIVTTLEPDDNSNTSLFQELLPNCTATKIAAFGKNDSWVLIVRYTLLLDFGLRKRGSVTSKPFKLDTYERIASN